jgi:hypothetical protein
MEECKKLHNVQMATLYNSQGQIVNLSMNDMFACQFNDFLSYNPKSSTHKPQNYPSCCDTTSPISMTRKTTTDSCSSNNIVRWPRTG